MKKLFLLDALALIYRSYYALIRAPRITSQGKNTNAQFGFTNTLVELINKYQPTHMAVCFDTHAPTERHTNFEAYKANRQEAPEDLLASIPEIKKIINGFNIPVIEYPGYEADDIIGTLAWQAADEGYEVFMVTPDKDYGQLLTKEHIYMFKPAYMGKKEEILSAKDICEKWDIENVSQVVDILGLMGDAADNIPGIAGVGEKTAAKLLKQYHSLEGVIEHAAEIKGALGDKVRAGIDAAIMSKQLARIITEVPVTFIAEDYVIRDKNAEALSSIFSELEFRTLGKRILGESFQVSNATNVQTDLFGNVVVTPNSKATKKAGTTLEVATPALFDDGLKTIENTTHDYQLIDTTTAINQLVAELSAATEICFDTETTGLDATNCDIVGCSFAVEKGTAYYIPFTGDEAATLERLALLQPLFQNPNITWIGQNIKFDILVLKRYQVALVGPVFDTMVAHYVIEPEGRRSMDLLSEQFLNYQPISITSLIGKKGKSQLNMRDIPVKDVVDYAAEDADITLQLKEKLNPLLDSKDVRTVFEKVDNPLVKVLANMEHEGVKVDVDFLNEYSKELTRIANEHEKRVYDAAGVQFNLASPKQLGEVLFEKLQLDPKAKKTKTGQYATGEEVLVKLASKHAIVDDILAFRELTKLKNTYVDALPQLINPRTGRIHTSYNQTIAVTGRLSSTNPNLQNIPVRSDRGREIRKAFVPRTEEGLLLSADYSQIELRIVAALSGDKNMCEAFRSGIDVHQATAAKVFNVPTDEVTKEQRYKAKSVNFGIIYGQGAFGLSQNLDISRAEAKEIIDSYKEQFSGITAFMDATLQQAQQNGYVTTLLGRKNWLKDINSANAVVRGYAERGAINAPIQGTAADMIKLAMIEIDAALKTSGLQSKMILQVHDELIFDVVKGEEDALKALILPLMENALKLPNDVPVVAETGLGKNWLEAH